MVKSYSIRKVVNFKESTSEQVFKNSSDVVLAKIDPKNSLIIEANKFIPYECTFLETINKDIIVGEETFHSYKIPKTFTMYYSKSLKVIFVDAPNNVAKNFLKILEKNKDDFSFNRFDFNFTKMITKGYIAKGLWFKVDGVNVDSKAFFGDEVAQEKEAADAIGNSTASYLIAQLDILNTEKTIGFSKKSAITLYNSCANEEEYRKIAFLAYQLVANL